MLFPRRVFKDNFNSGSFRLQKIKNIIAQCKYGIHDLSRTELGSNRLPRFNMPLELGIDFGCQEFGKPYQRKKSYLVKDITEHRYEKFISDIKGQDVKGHGRSTMRVIGHVRDWLSIESHIGTLPGGDYMHKRYKRFQFELPTLCGTARLNMKKLTFGDFVKISRVWLEERET